MKSHIIKSLILIALFPFFAYLSFGWKQRPGDETAKCNYSRDTNICSFDKVASVKPANTTIVARVVGTPLTGECLPNPNNTNANYGINETDIGVMWETHKHEIMSVFGDNFGTTNGKDQVNWKSNALATSSDKNMKDGLSFSRMILDSGKVKELITSRAKTGQKEGAPDFEVTCIPTAGIAVGKRQYINYMSIHQWALGGDNDKWSVNYSELAYSDDYGQNWIKSGLKWAGNGNFAQTAYLKKDGKVYMFGTPSGRYGNVHVARVNEKDMLNKEAYEYWNSKQWVAGDESEAKNITCGATAEMSVAYNAYYKRYFMMYLSVTRRAIVFRDADDVTGNWSEEKVLMEDSGHCVYAPYFHPWFSSGKELYFVVSHACPKWAIFLYHADLNQDADGLNMVSEGSFEDYPQNPIAYRTQWNVPNATAVDDAHSGVVACKLSNDSSGVTKDVAVQNVAVKPNTNYVLTGWVKTSVKNNKVHFGVRKQNGGTDEANPEISTTEWTKLVKEFNSGNNTTVAVFCSLQGAPGLSVILDDVSLKPKIN